MRVPVRPADADLVHRTVNTALLTQSSVFSKRPGQEAASYTTGLYHGLSARLKAHVSGFYGSEQPRAGSRKKLKQYSTSPARHLNKLHAPPLSVSSFRYRTRRPLCPETPPPPQGMTTQLLPALCHAPPCTARSSRALPRLSTPCSVVLLPARPCCSLQRISTPCRVAG